MYVCIYVCVCMYIIIYIHIWGLVGGEDSNLMCHYVKKFVSLIHQALDTNKSQQYVKHLLIFQVHVDRFGPLN